MSMLLQFTALDCQLQSIILGLLPVFLQDKALSTVATSDHRPFGSIVPAGCAQIGFEAHSSKADNVFTSSLCGCACQPDYAKSVHAIHDVDACRTTPMRIEPKTFFANERTFLTWLHMAITIGTIAAALLGFSGSAQRSDKPAYEVQRRCRQFSLCTSD